MDSKDITLFLVAVGKSVDRNKKLSCKNKKHDCTRTVVNLSSIMNEKKRNSDRFAKNTVDIFISSIFDELMPL